MLNKTIKLCGMTLLGAMLMTFSPILTYAQYYTYTNNYAPLAVTTGDTTNITSSSVVLNGLINGTNLYSTYNLNTWFEYGTNTNFGYSTVQSNSNSGYADYSVNVAGLSSNTVYYFRAVAQNGQGVVYGSTDSFRTNYANVVNTDTNNISSTPGITTNEATSIASRSVKLNSLIINSVDNPFNTWFEWGSVPTLGNVTPTISMGSLSAAYHIDTLTGLTPKTTYYFRAVMENSSGRINGTTLSFTTNSVARQSSSVTSTSTTDDTTVTNTSILQPVTSTGTNLGASALLSGYFFPMTILGWLVLITLILLLIVISKSIYLKFSDKKIDSSEEHV